MTDKQQDHDHPLCGKKFDLPIEPVLLEEEPEDD